MNLFKKLLAVLLCLAMALSVVACSSDGGEESSINLDAIEETLAAGDESCNHEWDEWDEYVESGCTVDGLRVRTCMNCGKQESEVLPAHGHDVSDRKCMDCGAKIKKCDHEDTEEVVIKPATCTEKGKENEICTVCYTIVDENKIPATGHNMIAYEWKDATCTENGWYWHEACEYCGKNNREEIPAYGHEMRAGTCQNCGYVDTSFETVTAPGLAMNATTIAAPEVVTYTATAATIETHVGDFAQEDEVDQYTLTPTADGVYRIWFSEIYSGNYLKLYVLNNLGETVKYDTYCVNGDGVTVTLLAGQTYTIEARQQTGLCTYQLNIGVAKASVDISSYNLIVDSIDFTDQEVYYTISPVSTGAYYFGVNNMIAGQYVDIYVYNYLGETVKYDTYLQNGDGITASDLVAGQTYTVKVKERTNLGAYNLVIGAQRPTQDLGEYNSVTDGFQFANQANYYTFTANSTNLRLQMAGITGDSSVKLYLYNHLGEKIDSDTYCYNGEGITVNTLTVGNVYTIAVEYRYDLVNYTLNLYSGKDPVAVSSNMAVVDTIEYDGQVNTYNLTVDEAGEHEIMIAATTVNYGNVNVFVYNSAGSLVYESWYMSTGEYISMGELAVGDTYTILVEECGDFTGYTLSIQ